VIDSALGVAGLALWTILPFNPVRDPWLGARLVLSRVHIVFATLLGIALTRRPLGAWRVA
jgi:uncharacterized membrane protein SirB2